MTITITADIRAIETIKAFITSSNFAELISDTHDISMRPANKIASNVQISDTVTGMENAIAISADFHTNKQYDEFYNIFSRTHGGFMEIYQYIKSMADALTELENNNPQIWDEIEWQEFVELYVATIITESLASGEVADVSKVILRVGKK